MQPMKIPTVETERLLLRGWSDADPEPFADMNADPEVMRYMTGRLDRADSDALAARIVEDWAANGFGLWAVERRSDGRFIGFAGLWRPRFEAPFMPAVEVGWRLARDAWGFGYATEGGRASVRYGFEEVGLDEIVSFTAVHNARSRRVMERLGMTRDPADDFDHPRIEPGHPLRRHVLYRLSRADWQRSAGGAHEPP
jgi:RimJ/RimL family protein N-acetyltransferase